MEKWQRKLIKSKGSFYINLPKSVALAFGKKHNSVVSFSKVYDEKTRRILVVLDLD